MKYILTTLLISSALFASAQKLPSKVTITLTNRQILRIDSAIQAGANWTDSKQATNWYQASFADLYAQIRKQMINDTTKVKQSAGRP